MQTQLGRRLPFGAEPSHDGTHFRVWAPKHPRLHVVLEDERGSGECPPCLSHPDSMTGGARG